MSLVRFEGLDQMRKRIGTSQRTWDAALRIAVRRSGLRARRESREIAPGRIFDRSILNTVAAGGLSTTVQSYADPARRLSIATGRRPGQPPSLRALNRYIRTYGLAGAVSLRTRRAVRKSKVAQREVEAMAWRLQQTIRGRGTKAIPFITGAIQPSMADFRRYLSEATAKAMRQTFRAS